MVVKMPENPCAICRVEEATQLCDFVVSYMWMSNYGATTGSCDLPLCKECSKGSEAHDFCPEHFKMLDHLELKDKKMKRRISHNRAKLLNEWENKR
ncbi:hypothetical protein [Halobacillus sp. H74]|uniref:hypothetical protein n=1 Tax=Halobacillus sp. H74 TaxID=3457436 RepID=UPI003FCD99DE